MARNKSINTKIFTSELTIGLLLIVGVFALFHPLVGYDFVNYDDSGYISENAHVLRGLTSDGMIWAFTTGEMTNWHPLTWLSYMVDVEIFGPKPAGFHFTNVLFHALNSLLVFLVLNKITTARWRSAFVAALFALHPLHVESVAWISERKDVLSTFFWMLTIWAYARYVRVQSLKFEVQSSPENFQRSMFNVRCSMFFYLLALLFFTLGLMSKPMVVTLPFVLLLLDVWPLRRLPVERSAAAQDVQADQQVRPTRLLVEKIPFFLFTIVASIVTFLVQKQDGAVSSLAAVSMASRLENAFVSYARYLGNTFWPAELSISYPPVEHWSLLQVGGAVLLVLAISAMTILFRKRQPHLLVGWFWFVGTLVPVIGIVQVGLQSMADRYTYIPLIGLFIAITWTSANFFSRWNFPRFSVNIAGATILLVSAVLTKKQITHWKNSETLFRHAIKVTEKNIVAHENLATYLVDQGRYEEAIEVFRKGSEIAPNFADTRNNLGFALAKLERHDEAIIQYQLALKLRPNYAEAHNNFGISLAAIGNIEEAISQYEMALAKDPRHAKAHNNLGIAFMMRGDYESAVKSFRAACKLDPDYVDAVNGLAWILAAHPNPKFRDGTEAVRLATHAVELTGGQNASFLETLAAAYAEAGDFPNALKFLRTGMELAKANTDEELTTRFASEFQMFGQNQPYRDASLKEN